MSDRVMNVRHSRVSPLPGRGSAVAYSTCPGSDPDMLDGNLNVLAIPMSAIQTTAALNNNMNNNNTSPRNFPGECFIYCLFLRVYFIKLLCRLCFSVHIT